MGDPRLMRIVQAILMGQMAKQVPGGLRGRPTMTGDAAEAAFPPHPLNTGVNPNSPGSFMEPIPAPFGQGAPVGMVASPFAGGGAGSDFASMLRQMMANQGGHMPARGGAPNLQMNPFGNQYDPGYSIGGGAAAAPLSPAAQNMIQAMVQARANGGMPSRALGPGWGGNPGYGRGDPSMGIPNPSPLPTFPAETLRRGY